MKQKEIIEKLRGFSPVAKEDHIEIKVPVVMRLYDAFLMLQITPLEEGYMISDDGHTFDEWNHDLSYYFHLFLQNDTNCHYDIQSSKEKIYKVYPENFSVAVALDEFVRFFIALDDFILKHNIT